MGTPAAAGPLTQGPMALVLADLQAYHRTLKGRGELLQARAVARCIELLRKRARRGLPN